MKLIIGASLALAVLGLAGCAPTMESANEVGGIVKEWPGLNKEGKALTAADAHCRKFGKAARVSGENVLNNTLSFDCVATSSN